MQTEHPIAIGPSSNAKSAKRIRKATRKGKVASCKSAIARSKKGHTLTARELAQGIRVARDANWRSFG
jgi:hypothetical protein